MKIPRDLASRLLTLKDLTQQAGRELATLFRRAFRLDFPVALLALICAVSLGSLVTRSTEDARRLAAYINDEPALSMALDAMSARPFGNPARFYDRAIGDPKGPGPEWSTLRYSGFHYYGGLYPGIGFVAYGPMKLLGAPVFPTAPIILRIISVAAAMLALLALYNIGREVAGRVVGFGAAAFLLTDSNFVYYGSIIHPDTLQLLLGLLGVMAAIRHAKDGQLASLVALGVIAGLSQGTKLGANWFAPVLLLTPHLGLLAGAPGVVASLDRLKAYIGRVALLASVAVLFWILSTPYAVLDPYYFKSTFGVLGVVSAGSTVAESFTRQFWAYHALFGPQLFWLFLTALIWTTLRLVSGRLPPPLVIIWLTIISQFLWYGYLNRFWVITGYVMVAYGLLAVLAGAMIRDAFLALSRHSIWAGRIALAALLPFLAVDLAHRGLKLANYTLKESLRDRSTVVQLDKWLKTNDIRRDAHIIWDDIAYADPNSFPNSRMHGGLLRWRDLRAAGEKYPDYIVLSSTIHDNKFWTDKMAEQRGPRMDSFDLSLRLYQDLLHKPGAPGSPIPWISQVGTIAPDTHDAAPFQRSAPRFTNGPWAGIFFQPLHSFYSAWSTFDTLRDLHRRPDLVTTGPTLRIYKVNAREAECPREQAFSSETGAGTKAFDAFDAALTPWISKAKGAAAEGAHVGIDLGCQTKAGGESITLRWIDPIYTPETVLIEVSDDGAHWRQVARHSPNYALGQPVGKVDNVKLEAPVRARYWRLVAERVPEGRNFGLWDMVLPD